MIHEQTGRIIRHRSAYAILPRTSILGCACSTHHVSASKRRIARSLGIIWICTVQALHSHTLHWVVRMSWKLLRKEDWLGAQGLHEFVWLAQSFCPHGRPYERATSLETCSHVEPAHDWADCYCPASKTARNVCAQSLGRAGDVAVGVCGGCFEKSKHHHIIRPVNNLWPCNLR